MADTAAAPAPRLPEPGCVRDPPPTARRRAGRMGSSPRPRSRTQKAAQAGDEPPSASPSPLAIGRSEPSGRSGHAGWAIPIPARPGSSPPPPTRSADRWTAIVSGARRPRPRSRGGARRSSLPCSTPCPMTCERRSPRSGPPRACSWTPTSSGRPTQRREIAASIDREAEWLNRLVTNLLDMSRVEAGELRPTLAVMALAGPRRQKPWPARTSRRGATR